MAKDLIDVLLQEKDEKPVILETIVDGVKTHIKKDGVIHITEEGIEGDYCLMSSYDVVNKEESGQMFVYKIDKDNKDIKVVEDLEVAKKVYCSFMYKVQQEYEYIPPKKD